MATQQAVLLAGTGKWSELMARWMEEIQNNPRKKSVLVCKRTGQRFTFPQDKSPKYTAKVTLVYKCVRMC